jgi:hypothetical protein
METITFSGVVKDHESHWYFGFYRVKPDTRIANPNVPSGASNKLVYIINKGVESKLGRDDCRCIIGRQVTITGHWFTKPLADRHYFELESIVVAGGMPSDDDSARAYEVSAAEHELSNIDY